MNAELKKLLKKKGFIAFLWKLLIFSIISFAAIPGIIHLAAAGRIKAFEVYYTSEALFFALMIILFAITKRESLMRLKPVKLDIRQLILFLSLSIIPFYLYYRINYFATAFSQQNNLHMLAISSYLFFVCGALFIAAAIFNIGFLTKYFKEIGYSFIAGFLFYSGTLILWANWRLFSGTISTIVYNLLRLTYDKAFLHIGQGDPLLGSDNFSVYIGAPCSGVESIIMFIFLFLLVMAFDEKGFDKRKILPLFSIGIMGMFAMSIFRIYLLLVVGSFDADLAMTFFHSNLGWFLFVGYLLIFWYYSYPWLRKQPNSST